MTHHDIAFIGHVCYDEVVPFEGQTRIAPGSAVLCGAMAAARVGKKVTVVTRISETDDHIMNPMRDAGMGTYVIPTSETTYMKVIHPSTDVDVRQIIETRCAGPFALDDIPTLDAAYVHLAGISDQEFTLEFMTGLKERGHSLSVDMQSFVRQMDPITKEIFFHDVQHKEKIVRLMDKVKLDVVEAEMLTGTRDLEQAALAFEGWGCPEVIITQAEGVLARVQGKTYYEKFTNRSVIGRTGRGDTTFGGYLAWRLEHNVAESLKFAGALVSIKMETPGPFQGTLDDVLKRMNL
jgi:sugar/nucleoside kinase (ribokinase family)